MRSVSVVVSWCYVSSLLIFATAAVAGASPRGDASPTNSFRANGLAEICNDDIDNDGNEFVDCDDFACSASEFCTGETSCNDGLDNDENGFTDCDDFACSASEFCTGETSCNDGLDNDESGFTDCDDFACAGATACVTPLLVCPAGAAYSQQPSGTTDTPGFSDQADNNLRAFDNFSGLSGPITGIVWWGGGVSPAACTRTADDFEIAFFQDNGNQPGTLVDAQTFSPATVQATGSNAGFGELIRYEATFDTPIELAAGWVSVFGVNSGDGCFFYWANGKEGDNNAFSSGFGGLGADFAFCLITGPPVEICNDTIDNDGDELVDCADPDCSASEICTGETSCDDGLDNDENGFKDCNDLNCSEAPNCVTDPSLLCPAGAGASQPPSETTGTPGFSDEADNGIRAFDNFSGLTGPITDIVWWGGGTNPNECLRAQDDFEVAFFPDNGGQPGANAVATRTVISATSIATGADAGFGGLRRYEATFDPPIALAAGWVSVFGVNNNSGCFFYWANGDDGNGTAFSSAIGAIGADFAFCLVTAPPTGGHTADLDASGEIDLSEVLRVTQLYNASGLHCADPPESTEDGYEPGADDTQETCGPHDSDYNLQDWFISLSELLRVIQFFNTGNYFECPEDTNSEDGYCALA